MSFDHFLIWFVLILVAGKIGAEASERLNMPAVLGELVAGILVGAGGIGLLARVFPNLATLQVDASNQTLQVLGQLGVVLLLFEAGLDSNLDDLRKLGPAAIWLASAGVIFTAILSFGSCRIGGLSVLTSMFLGGAMASTSVGISARTFSDLAIGDSLEAKTVLGAAVADDVMGLVILGVLTGIVAIGKVSLAAVGLTALAAVLFLVLSLPAGLYLAPKIMRYGNKMKTRAALAVTALVLCFVLAIVAGKAAGLSPIIGAFIAGLILSESEFKEHLQLRIKPLADVFIPVFFVLMGAAMPISSISPGTASGRVALGLALALAVVAIVSKVAAGLSTYFAKVNKLVIGCGMIPRGEVTLIFAAYGLKNHVIGGNLYSAILIVVLLTTFLTPPLLKIALTTMHRGPEGGKKIVENAEATEQLDPVLEATSLSGIV
jgi:Kef-type K+ transport system membrane component KefB